MSVRCPECGGEATMVGLPAGIYPAAFRCYAHGEFNFSASGPEADAVCAESRARSRANAQAMLPQTQPTAGIASSPCASTPAPTEGSAVK